MLPSRILLKISGEMLKGTENASFEADFLLHLGKSIIDLHTHNVQVALVLGGGNIFRGIAGSTFGISQPPADLMGMLATIINCIALQETLCQLGHTSHIMSALPVGTAAAPIDIQIAKAALSK
jgi:uridylate kinase